MGLDDFIESEVAIAVGIAAAVFSPRVRHAMRRGAVLGLAGVMTAGDAVIGAARGAAQEARSRSSAGNGAGAGAPDVPTPKRRPATAEA
jgi:hypothetical protein